MTVSSSPRQDRTTHDYTGDLVVFLIGMRVNKPARVRSWLPVFGAMRPMLTELSRDPDSGLMGYELTVGRNGPLIVQYWNSLDKLYAYASRPDAEHRPAWTRFNRLVRAAPGVVGVWHETYQVSRAESIYSGMPPFGLARATASIPVGRRGDRAAERMAAGSVAVAG